jgi:hypothetical protein
LWPTHSSFLYFTVCRIFLSCLTLCNNNSSFSHRICQNWFFHLSTPTHFKTLQAFLIYFPKYPSFITIQSFAPNAALY